MTASAPVSRAGSPPGEVDGETPWDLLVIGGGTAGIVGAKTAARLGARVLLVERDRTGGDCLWTGCVPSKALLAAADVAAQARRGASLGVEVAGVDVDFGRVMAHVRSAIAHIAPVDSAEALEDAGVSVLHGSARFTSPRTAEIHSPGRPAGRTVSFRQALLATGAAPAVPDLPGLRDVDHLTSETVWDLDELPEDLVVLGGGSIGCELGQAFARLGTRVTVVEGADRLLVREDHRAAALIATALDEDGATVLTGRAAVRIERVAGPRGVLVLDDGHEVPFARLLVAVGRAPRTGDLGMERAGVRLDDHGFVVVDDLLRTSDRRIWAAGDLTGHRQFTHTAGVHGSLAASNAVLGTRRRVDLTAVPRVTYTDPEVAAVGVPTDREREGVRVIDWPHRHVDRAVAEGATGGFTRVAVDRRGHLLGATVVGPRAGETIGELTLAVARGLTTRDLAGVTHAYPTYNDGPWNAAISDVQDQLERPGPRRAVAGLTGVRRWWVARGD